MFLLLGVNHSVVTGPSMEARPFGYDNQIADTLFSIYIENAVKKLKCGKGGGADRHL